jgi:hypothetical protein
MKTEIGGDRLGSGNKQEVSLRNYERSSHDLGYIWRSSMASGTLVPFMSEVALPGDSFDIDLDCDVKTLPTVGPLFGSYKVQLDVFQCPIRLYNGKLHMNMLNIGMDMSQILLPQVELHSQYNVNKGDNQQINSSSIYSYLNIRGLGRKSGSSTYQKRYFNAIPYLGYWDIYKNYYANKQEERGYVIHAIDLDNAMKVISAKLTTRTYGGTINEYGNINGTQVTVDTSGTGGDLSDLIYNVATTLVFQTKYNNNNNEYGKPNTEEFTVKIAGVGVDCVTVFEEVVQVQNEDRTYTTTFRGYTGTEATSQTWESEQTTVENTEESGLGTPQLKEFPLDNIDDMRMDILEAVRDTTAFEVNASSSEPYGLGLGYTGSLATEAKFYATASQEGLGIKTYQSDLFNNWISTEWIDGSNGINEVTAVSTSGDEFTIDSLNLANKVYNMLNRIAISGGSYDDWLDAVYTHERAKSCENPIYHGSLIKELAFEEVVSMSDTTVNGEDQPLGTLAGRGRLTGKNKGGKIKIKVDEPSYIIGLVSLTPRIDYSQGNKWDTNLKTMNDLHKPALDAIGYQDLITDQMAWFDTETHQNGNVTYSTAGKQPAWINYMTNVNQTRGSFAEQGNSMFMTLNRRYEQGTTGIEDLTTYVDPSKYNNIFADEALDSQNFWVQISNRILARRKMSAKVIPNL